MDGQGGRPDTCSRKPHPMVIATHGVAATATRAARMQPCAACQLLCPCGRCSRGAPPAATSCERHQALSPSSLDGRVGRGCPPPGQAREGRGCVVDERHGGWDCRCFPLPMFGCLDVADCSWRGGRTRVTWAGGWASPGATSQADGLAGRREQAMVTPHSQARMQVRRGL